MTRTEHVFGEQAWLRALKGTALGRSVQFALTQGTPPPPTLNEQCPVTGSRFPWVAHRPRGHSAGRPASCAASASAACSGWPPGRCTGSPGRKGLGRQDLGVTLEPLADALRRGGKTGVRPVDLSLIMRPGLQLRLAVVALRAGVLRYVTEDGIIVEEDACTPAPGAACGPVDLIEGAVASASVPLVFHHAISPTTTTSMAGCSRSSRCGPRCTWAPPGSLRWSPCRWPCPETIATSPRARRPTSGSAPWA